MMMVLTHSHNNCTHENESDTTADVLSLSAPTRRTLPHPTVPEPTPPPLLRYPNPPLPLS